MASLVHGMARLEAWHRYESSGAVACQAQLIGVLCEAAAISLPAIAVRTSYKRVEQQFGGSCCRDATTQVHIHFAAIITHTCHTDKIGWQGYGALKCAAALLGGQKLRELS